MTFLNQVHHTITEYGLLETGDTVLVGVSGGADSMALLEALCFWQGVLGLKVIAGHVNHGLRRTAGRDQHFVERFCDERGILCETVCVSIAKRPARSLEELAREKRFSALAALAGKHHADAVALAHHQDDLAETVLMRVLRGTGLQGLQAILPKRQMHGTRFVRPLIQVARHEIEAFLQKRGITYCTDPTNADTKFLRNKIRHELLPLLKKDYNSNIAQTLSSLAEACGPDHDFLAAEAGKVFAAIVKRCKGAGIAFDIEDLRCLHPAILHGVLRLGVCAAAGSTRALTLEHIRRIEHLVSGRAGTTSGIHLPQGLKVALSRGRLRFQPDQASA